jgi:hypothetical protein
MRPIGGRARFDLEGQCLRVYTLAPFSSIPFGRGTALVNPAKRDMALRIFTACPPARAALVVALLAAAAWSGGCVHRRLTIRSNPPGAQVYIDDQEVGTTPISVSYTYYGTRKIQLVKDGFETTTTLHTLRAPWYQVPPLDFASENLWPREIRDERVLDFQLAPQQVVPTDEIVRRAEQLRRNTRLGILPPAP